MPGYLKQLEVKDFKSYKGKKIIPFKKFTAVIGPNGCGKSNLMDAISFVLGEKTSNLRVKSVKELIHGAPIKRPVASTAYVTAHYMEEQDDGQEKEIIFHRKILGSGTEYRINGNTVTPKEYQEKLESIGILIKAKNFLVFQGAIESIAMKTPKERTGMFEKISSSGELATEYEAKKSTMTKTEEETNFSLNKKKGVTAEKKEAKAEKEEAEKYQKLKQDLSDAKLEAQLFKLYHAEIEINNIFQEVKGENKELERILSRKKTIEEHFKSKKAESAKLSREQALVEKKMNDKESELNRKRPMYIKAKEKRDHAVTKLEETRKSLAKTKEQQRRQQKEIEDVNRELEEVKKMAEQFEADFSEESEGQSLELMGTQMEEYLKLKEEAGKQGTALQMQLDKVNRDQKSDQEALEQCNYRKNELLARQKHLEDKKRSLRERLTQLDDYIKTNVDSVNKHRGDYEDIERRVRTAQTQCREMEDLLSTVQNELNEAKTDKHASARQVRKAEILESMTKLFPGVHGRLVDLCEPVHKRYAIAITKVLGKNMDAVVTDTEQTARDCIQYNKEQRGEPITFLPLDSIQTRPINEQLRQLGGTAKLVIDVIHFKPPTIKKALQYACGNAIVCDNMEEARKFAFSGSERRKTVSLDGTMFERSGVMSGGLSDIRAKAKRWDQKHVDSLKRRRDKYVADIKELQRERRKEADLSAMKSQIDGLENRLKFAKKDKETTEGQGLRNCVKEMETNAVAIDELEPDFEKYQRQIKGREKEIRKLADRLNAVQDEIFAEFCVTIGVENIRQYEEKQLKAVQEKQEKKLEFTKQQSRLNNQLEYLTSRDYQAHLKKLEKSITAEEKEIEKLRNIEKDHLEEIDQDTSELDRLRLEFGATKNKIEEKESEIKEIRKSLTANAKEESTLQKKVTSKERQLEEKLADRHNFFQQCKLEDIKLPLKKGSLNDISDQTSSSHTDEDTDGNESLGSSQIARRIYEKESHIEVDFHKLPRKFKELSDAKEIKSTLQEIESRNSKLEATLSRIAAPNMKAMDKLDDVQARLKETSNEFESIRKRARKAKMEFEAVKKQRYDRFMNSFEHVSNKIDDIYKELSNNPSAQAFLGAENNEEPYLEGIGYNCVAPGKRFRPMDNLSGGEKTVAALALLFAIHSYQPAPFFVLDEIDAALDNTNINRVARYIKEQTHKNFQCIVISLKEEFYCKADALVGITLEPDMDCTTTKVFSLDLTQYPE
ncbi:structural maintenance of chromosomes protein 1A-like [Rhopilema esculentum]|uniref:structural maintenance of chromosomes protein 1A-like n=1 Tax=Rhopilema esculentum TaxID=499914 RepID=UPI0031D5B3D9|eukprot:gene352-10015_t